MTRPTASEEESSMRRFVTKLSVRSPMPCSVCPGILKKTGTLQSIRPKAPQKYFMTKSSMTPW